MILDLSHASQGDHFSLLIAHLELRYRFFVDPEGHIRLDIHLPGPAELVEIVDIVTSQKVLESANTSVKGRHGLALGAVDIDE